MSSFRDLAFARSSSTCSRTPKADFMPSRNLRKMVKNRGKDPGPDPAADGKLRKPGFKVLHVQDVDFRTHTPTFVDASQTNPLLVKGKSPPCANHDHDRAQGRGHLWSINQARQVCRDEVDKVDTEILSVFDRSEISRRIGCVDGLKRYPKQFEPRAGQRLTLSADLSCSRLKTKTPSTSTTSMGTSPPWPSDVHHGHPSRPCGRLV